MGLHRVHMVIAAALAASCTVLTNLDGLGGDAGDVPDVTTNDVVDSAAVDVADASAALYIPSPGRYYYDPKANANDTVVFQNDSSVNLKFDTRLACDVLVDGGSWSWTIAENSNHTSTYFFDTAPGTLTSSKSLEVILGNIATVMCQSPVTFIATDLDGGAQTQFCTGTNSLIDGSFGSGGPYTFLGEELVTSADAAPIAKGFEFLMSRTVTGTQSGSVTIEWWLDETTGLPLRVTVDEQILSPGPPNLGNVTYNEHAEYTIESTTPTAIPPLDAATGG